MYVLVESYWYFSLTSSGRYINDDSILHELNSKERTSNNRVLKEFTKMCSEFNGVVKMPKRFYGCMLVYQLLSKY